MDYESIINVIELTKAQLVNWRYGQTVFNVLYFHYPVFADSIRATELDPFYRDDIAPKTLDAFAKYLVDNKTN